MKAVNKLPSKAIENLSSKDKGYKASDGEGLYLWITPSGGKIWRIDYRSHGKSKTAVLGPYPEISLKQARILKADFRKQLAQGVDPSEEKKRQKSELALRNLKQLRTVIYVSEEWWNERTINLTDKYRQGLYARLRKYVFPFIGQTPIDKVIFSDLVSILKQIEELGRTDMPSRVAQIIKQVFKYAKQMRYIQEDISVDLTDILKPTPPRTHRASIVNPSDVGELLRRIEAYRFRASPAMYSALWLMPYTFLRSNELRGARWDEIDFDAQMWYIPAERMKMRKTHVVPLAHQVIDKLKELQKVSWGEFLFPSPRKNGYITAEGLRKTLFHLGYGKDEMCIHGFRSMASTLLNEQGKYRHDVIELQLAHKEENQVRAAYNHAQYMEERKIMMQEWADYLDLLRIGIADI